MRCYQARRGVQLQGSHYHWYGTVPPFRTLQSIPHHVSVHDNAGYTDLPSRLPTQSSTLYANNITKLLLSIGPQGSKRFAIDLDDEVVRGSIVLQDGALLFPPPKKPAPQVAAPTPAEVPKAAETTKELTPWQKASREVCSLSFVIILGEAGERLMCGSLYVFCRWRL